MGITESCCDDYSVCTRKNKEDTPASTITDEFERSNSQHYYLSSNHKHTHTQSVLPIQWNGYETEKKKTKIPIRLRKLSYYHGKCETEKDALSNNDSDIGITPIKEL